jgi:hypothetical protein
MFSGNQRLSGISRRDGFLGMGIIPAIVPNSVARGDQTECGHYSEIDRPKTIYLDFAKEIQILQL